MTIGLFCGRIGNMTNNIEMDGCNKCKCTKGWKQRKLKHVTSVMGILTIMAMLAGMIKDGSINRQQQNISKLSQATNYRLQGSLIGTITKTNLLIGKKMNSYRKNGHAKSEMATLNMKIGQGSKTCRKNGHSELKYSIWSMKTENRCNICRKNSCSKLDHETLKSYCGNKNGKINVTNHEIVAGQNKLISNIENLFRSWVKIKSINNGTDLGLIELIPRIKTSRNRKFTNMGLNELILWSESKNRKVTNMGQNELIP